MGGPETKEDRYDGGAVTTREERLRRISEAPWLVLCHNHLYPMVHSNHDGWHCIHCPYEDKVLSNNPRSAPKKENKSWPLGRSSQER